MEHLTGFRVNSAVLSIELVIKMFHITLLIFLATVGSTLATNYSCEKNYGGYCIVKSQKYIVGQPINFVNMSSEIYFIIMSNCELPKVPAKLFVDFKKLKSLELTRNNIKQITSTVFKNATIMEYLSLNNNSIKILKNKVFVNSPNMKNLVMSNNKIKLIAVNAFYGLKKITSIDFSNNVLTSLALGLFDNLPLLNDVRLSSNLLKTITKDWFKNNPMIAYLYLAQNNIDTIEDEVTSQMKDLSIIDLTNNLLVSSTNLKPSSELRMTSNRLQTITLSPALTQIRIENNLLTTISCMDTNMTIENLYASNNSLSSFGCIRNMSSLYSLYLQRNKFTAVSKTIFTKLVNLQTLDLSSNPIKKTTPVMFAPLVSLSMLTIDRMTSAQNIQAQLSALQYISLNTTTWNCTTLLAAVKVYNSQKVTMTMNTPPPGKKAVCQLKSYEINKISKDEKSSPGFFK